ncbi:FtsX-like permease family protein [Chitinophaga sp. G-6-1-13]|uniref:FtsX-like permease family protein n=1 Tax=Chitinophaga fulva TaxID=2728842 RepID=A0A848GLM7_9BACT|nr:ABC transporter permease [Chitinophaga fulva]NML38837.1 FtsX-like permease family protein [Chitinophaga fulva]
MNLSIKSMFRRLWRQRLFSFLNIAGIAVSVSACWVIYRIVSYEYSFDSQLPDRAYTYRLVTGLMFDIKENYNGGVSKPMYQAMREQVPGLKRVVPVFGQWVNNAETKDQQQRPVVVDDVKEVVATDSSYFMMVPYTWLAGNPATALQAPESVVLTESRARSYFGTLSPQAILGRTITYNKEKTRTVTGVVKDLGYPSEFTAKEFFKLPLIEYELAEWTNTNGSDKVYLQMAAGADTGRVMAQISKIGADKWSEQTKHWNLPSTVKRWFKLMPFEDSHFSTYISEGSGHKANRSVMRGLIGLGILLVIVACINFVNLTTAQLPQRSLSIGVRKVLGSSNTQLMRIIMGETFLIVLLAILAAFPLTTIAYRFLGDIIPEGMMNYTAGWGIVLFLAALLTGITLLAGSYPAWLMTRVQPAGIIQGQGVLNTGNNRRLALRKVLIVFQFVIAQVFIAGTLIMGAQMNYTLKKELGFNKDAVVLIDIPWKLVQNPAYTNKQYVLAEALRNETGVAAVSVGRPPLSDGYSSSMYEYYNGKKQDPARRQVYKKFIDTAYIRTYHMQLVAGRNIRPSDTTNEFVLNETAVKGLGFASPQEAIGKMIGQVSEQKFPIVGVVKDFHTRDFHATMEPVALMAHKDGSNGLNILLTGNDPAQWQATLKMIEQKWHAMYPGEEWTGKFYDQTLAALYKQDRSDSKLVNLATGVAIVISCLGLFGLAVLVAFQRTKEIGIRKVLGATVTGIVQLLMSDFVKLVTIAFIIATPIAWWGMDRWLRGFAYSIKIEWWMFALSGVIAVLIAIFTVSFQAVKAALSNPVKSLRTV